MQKRAANRYLYAAAICGVYIYIYIYIYIAPGARFWGCAGFIYVAIYLNMFVHKKNAHSESGTTRVQLAYKNDRISTNMRS